MLSCCMMSFISESSIFFYDCVICDYDWYHASVTCDVVLYSSFMSKIKKSLFITLTSPSSFKISPLEKLTFISTSFFLISSDISFQTSYHPIYTTSLLYTSLVTFLSYSLILLLSLIFLVFLLLHLFSSQTLPLLLLHFLYLPLFSMYHSLL